MWVWLYLPIVLISKLDSIELTRCLGSRQTMMAFIFDDDELRNISTFFAGKPQFLGGEIPGFHKKLRFHRHGLFFTVDCGWYYRTVNEAQKKQECSNQWNTFRSHRRQIFYCIGKRHHVNFWWNISISSAFFPIAMVFIGNQDDM